MLSAAPELPQVVSPSVSLDWSELGRLARTRALTAVSAHFALVGGAMPSTDASSTGNRLAAQERESQR